MVKSSIKIGERNVIVFGFLYVLFSIFNEVILPFIKSPVHRPTIVRSTVGHGFLLRRGFKPQSATLAQDGLGVLHDFQGFPICWQVICICKVFERHQSYFI